MSRASIVRMEDALEAAEVCCLIAPVAGQDRIGTQDKRVAFRQANAQEICTPIRIHRLCQAAKNQTRRCHKEESSARDTHDMHPRRIAILGQHIASLEVGSFCDVWKSSNTLAIPLTKESWFRIGRSWATHSRRRGEKGQREGRTQFWSESGFAHFTRLWMSDPLEYF